jgi:hypothetical protein
LDLLKNKNVGFVKTNESNLNEKLFRVYDELLDNN